MYVWRVTAAVALSLGLLSSQPTMSAAAQGRHGGRVSYVAMHVAGTTPAQASNSPFAFAMTQPGRPTEPVGWNPDQPITWFWSDGTASAKRELGVVLASVAKASGLRFRETANSPDITIHGGTLSGGIAGQTFFATSTLSGPHCDVATMATITFARTSATWSRAMRLNLYLHEVGHALGLNHVTSTQSVMYATLTARTSLGTGDRAGLKRLGHIEVCSDESAKD